MYSPPPPLNHPTYILGGLFLFCLSRGPHLPLLPFSCAISHSFPVHVQHRQAISVFYGATLLFSPICFPSSPNSPIQTSRRSCLEHQNQLVTRKLAPNPSSQTTFRKRLSEFPQEFRRLSSRFYLWVCFREPYGRPIHNIVF